MLKDKYNNLISSNEQVINNNEILKNEINKLKDQVCNKENIIHNKMDEINQINQKYILLTKECKLKNEYVPNESDTVYKKI